MPLFEDINLETIDKDGELFINARQLSWYLVSAMETMYAESVDDSIKKPFSIEEFYYFYGLMTGINSVVMVISQGGIEHDFHTKINSVEDLMQFFKDEKND